MLVENNRAQVILGQLEKLHQNEMRMLKELEHTPIVKFPSLSQTFGSMIASTKTLESQISQAADLTKRQVKTLTEFVNGIKQGFQFLKNCVDAKKVPSLCSEKKPLGNPSEMTAVKIAIVQSISNHSLMRSTLEDYVASIQINIRAFSKEADSVVAKDVSRFTTKLENAALKVKILKCISEYSKDLTTEQAERFSRNFQICLDSIRVILNKISYSGEDFLSREMTSNAQKYNSQKEELKKEFPSEGVSLVSEILDVFDITAELNSIKGSFLVDDIEHYYEVPLQTLKLETSKVSGNAESEGSGCSLM